MDSRKMRRIRTISFSFTLKSKERLDEKFQHALYQELLGICIKDQRWFSVSSVCIAVLVGHRYQQKE
jgi:hypothetical protein